MTVDADELRRRARYWATCRFCGDHSQKVRRRVVYAGRIYEVFSCPKCGADHGYDWLGFENFEEMKKSAKQLLADIISTPTSILQLKKTMNEREPALAKMLGKDHEYLDCDQMTDLMSIILEEWHVDHQIMIGVSDEGSSHTWVRVDGIDYDPTEQGCNEGVILEVKTYE